MGLTNVNKVELLINELASLHEENARLRYALEMIDANWCRHPSTRLDLNPRLDRDWCSECCNWVRRNETNPARRALDEHRGGV